MALPDEQHAKGGHGRRDCAKARGNANGEPPRLQRFPARAEAKAESLSEEFMLDCIAS
jgi:hypothetical protein